MFQKTDINHVVQRGKALTEQNKSTEGQRALTRTYESIRDLVPETPRSAWRAWIRLGEQAEKRLSYLKRNARWNRV